MVPISKRSGSIKCLAIFGLMLSSYTAHSQTPPADAGPAPEAMSQAGLPAVIVADPSSIACDAPYPVGEVFQGDDLEGAYDGPYYTNAPLYTGDRRGLGVTYRLSTDMTLLEFFPMLEEQLARCPSGRNAPLSHMVAGLDKKPKFTDLRMSYIYKWYSCKHFSDDGEVLEDNYGAYYRPDYPLGPMCNGRGKSRVDTVTFEQEWFDVIKDDERRYAVRESHSERGGGYLPHETTADVLIIALLDSGFDYIDTPPARGYVIDHHGFGLTSTRDRRALCNTGRDICVFVEFNNYSLKFSERIDRNHMRDSEGVGDLAITGFTLYFFHDEPNAVGE